VHPDFKTKISLDEFKEIELKYEIVRNNLKNEKLHASYLDLRDIVHTFERKINKSTIKDELE
jgi:hypothetical protein